MKLVAQILVGIASLTLLSAAVTVGAFLRRPRHFKAQPSSGYHADFYLYISPDASRAAR